MTYVFLALIGGLILVSLVHTKTVYNLFTVLAAPYFLIVLINQFVASPYFGFFKISDDTLVMLLEGLLAFFIGTIPFSKANQGENQLSPDEKLKKYNMKAMSLFVLICGLVCVIQSLMFLMNSGQIIENFDDVTSSLNEGWVAHLKLMVLSVVPITLYYGIKKHDAIAIIGTSLVFVSVFLSFIKYNIICPVAATIIFIALNDKQLSKKSIIPMIVLPIILFMLNYYIGFYARGTNIQSSFYWNHLWGYIGGSLIYDNYIFTRGIRVGIGSIEKLMTFVFALPNMFTSKLFGFRMFPHIRQQDLIISNELEQSNVVDAIGYLYPSFGDALDILEFLLVMLFLGLLFSMFVRTLLNSSQDRFNTILPFFLAEFVLMSFFGTFYVSPGPWEQLVWCALIPQFFLISERRHNYHYRPLNRDAE